MSDAAWGSLILALMGITFPVLIGWMVWVWERRS
jgi:hypothetical protein